MSSKMNVSQMQTVVDARRFSRVHLNDPYFWLLIFLSCPSKIMVFAEKMKCAKFTHDWIKGTRAAFELMF